MRKLGYSPYAWHNSILPFEDLFSVGQNALGAAGLAGVSAVAFWGGTDIDPKYYKAKPHPWNGFSPSSLRDLHEWQLMDRAIDAGIPLIGICRGAQFLCAKAGGKLIQDCSNHGSSHSITVLDKSADGSIKETEMKTSSSHHQMMYVDDMSPEDYQILGWSTEFLSTHYDGEAEAQQLIPKKEVEVVFFPKIRALAIQGHPEWMTPNSEFVIWCNNQIKELIG